jgi:predicted transposase YbfD/YdcC
VKDNQPVLKEEIADYVQDVRLRDTAVQCDEQQRRAALTRQGGLGEIGLHRCGERALYQQERNKRRYYICSRGLTAEELLRYVRLEWTVESMHWLLDVHFGEDFCRIEDRNARQISTLSVKPRLTRLKFIKPKRNPNVLSYA